VTRELGAGGMATVYLAHDLKHERDVAIKVLHPDLGAALGQPASWAHGDVAARILVAISEHLTTERRKNGWPLPRGRVVAAETGFTLQRNPDTVRAPDVAYVRIDRCPTQPSAAFPEFAPDLVIEVLSTSDRAAAVREKVADRLAAGSPPVWVVDPADQVARIYRADGSESHVAATDALHGEDVLPGLRVALTDLFD
jgi:Uma2 family endonuclease